MHVDLRRGTKPKITGNASEMRLESYRGEEICEYQSVCLSDRMASIHQCTDPHTLECPVCLDMEGECRSHDARRQRWYRAGSLSHTQTHTNTPWISAINLNANFKVSSHSLSLKKFY